jgi:hypothetical protein
MNSAHNFFISSFFAFEWEEKIFWQNKKFFQWIRRQNWIDTKVMQFISFCHQFFSLSDCGLCGTTKMTFFRTFCVIAEDISCSEKIVKQYQGNYLWALAMLLNDFGFFYVCLLLTFVSSCLSVMIWQKICR